MHHDPGREPEVVVIRASVVGSTVQELLGPGMRRMRKCPESLGDRDYCCRRAGIGI